MTGKREQMLDSTWVKMGTCRRPHGVKGAFDFRLDSGEDSILEEGMEVLLKPLDKLSCLNSQGEVFKLKKLVYGHKVMAYLDSIEDRSLVENMIPFEIYLKRDHFPELDSEEEVYYGDLKGLIAYDFETNRELGRVESVYDNRAQAVLCIGRGQGAFEVPFVDNFVKKIDLENNSIWIILPEYF